LGRTKKGCKGGTVERLPSCVDYGKRQKGLTTQTGWSNKREARSPRGGLDRGGRSPGRRAVAVERLKGGGNLSTKGGIGLTAPTVKRSGGGSAEEETGAPRVSSGDQKEKPQGAASAVKAGGSGKGAPRRLAKTIRNSWVEGGLRENVRERGQLSKGAAIENGEGGLRGGGEQRPKAYLRVVGIDASRAPQQKPDAIDGKRHKGPPRAKKSKKWGGRPGRDIQGKGRSLPKPDRTVRKGKRGGRPDQTTKNRTPGSS